MPSLSQSSLSVPAIMKAWSRLSIWQGPAISDSDGRAAQAAIDAG
jgi:hypothetical protein